MKNFYVKTSVVCSVTRTYPKMISQYIKKGFLVPFIPHEPKSELNLTVADIVMMGIMRACVPGGGDKEPLQQFALELNALVDSSQGSLNKMHWIIIDLCTFEWKLVDDIKSFKKLPNKDARLLKAINIRELTDRYRYCNTPQ